MRKYQVCIQNIKYNISTYDRTFTIFPHNQNSYPYIFDNFA